MATSSPVTMPSPPWRASAGCRKSAGVPVLVRVAAILRAMIPEVPAPETRADLEVDPFPHLVIRHALPDDVCDRLIAEYPPLDTITGGGDVAANARFDLQARAVRDAGVSPLWQAFVERHTSNEFAREV